jgi:hypothetical protein
MDKVGMGWGLAFGSIWGFLYYTLDWPMAHLMIDKLDRGIKAASGASLVGVTGGALIMSIICGGVGCMLGGMAGTGRTGN